MTNTHACVTQENEKLYIISKINISQTSAMWNVPGRLVYYFSVATSNSNLHSRKSEPLLSTYIITWSPWSPPHSSCILNTRDDFFICQTFSQAFKHGISLSLASHVYWSAEEATLDLAGPLCLDVCAYSKSFETASQNVPSFTTITVSKYWNLLGLSKKKKASVKKSKSTFLDS